MASHKSHGRGLTFRKSRDCLRGCVYTGGLFVSKPSGPRWPDQELCRATWSGRLDSERHATGKLNSRPFEASSLTQTQRFSLEVGSCSEVSAPAPCENHSLLQERHIHQKTGTVAYYLRLAYQGLPLPGLVSSVNDYAGSHAISCFVSSSGHPVGQIRSDVFAQDRRLPGGLGFIINHTSTLVRFLEALYMTSMSFKAASNRRGATR